MVVNSMGIDGVTHLKEIEYLREKFINEF